MERRGKRRNEGIRMSGKEEESGEPSSQGTLRIEGAHFHSARQVSCSYRTYTPDKMWRIGEGWRGKTWDGKR